jgi:ABC-type multidrug transport system ATPase subunit
VTAGAPPLLEARNLERRFGPARALRGVSLVVHARECHLVVGPNGAGKTTLLRLLAGLARPFAGEVLVQGSPLTREPSSRRVLGLLSHQSHLYDDLTALENLVFTARLHGLPDPGAAARSALLSVGLEHRAGDPIRRLSRGMVQRVAIAAALLHGPALLLLDEPFTGLDPRSAEQVAGLLQSERDTGTGLVLVSHDVHESWELATHVHLLVQGAWVSSGPRQETLDQFFRRYREALHG